MYRFDENLWADLSSYNLIDPNLSLADVYSEPVEVAPQHDTLDVDNFDNVSLPISLLTREKKAVLKQLEMAFSNGIIWETDAEDFSSNPKVEKTFYLEAINHREETINNTSLEKVLAQFDSWTGTPLDILSPYGDIDFGRNIFADDFELDVPVKIYSEANDLVFKIDAPWMKIDTFKDIELYPNRLNLKSVLSVLPVKVNSKELKASFVDGEFRLEVPKKEIALHRERKNG